MSQAVKRIARAVLRRVSGKSEWGQAILAELDEVQGTWATLRWTAGGLRVAWKQRPVRVRRLVAATVGASLAVFTANQLLLGVRYEPTGSMAPAVPLSSRVVIDKVGFKLTGVSHGDLLVLWLTGVDGKRVSAVRRLIGLPSDRIDCRDGAVFRNGAVVTEPYLAAGTRTECEPYVVPDKAFYVLGDNRSSAVDSRMSGPASTQDLIGRVIVAF